MILFANPQKLVEDPTTHTKNYVIDGSQFFDIPLFYDERKKGRINEYNIQLISWNQAKYLKGTTYIY